MSFPQEDISFGDPRHEQRLRISGIIQNCGNCACQGQEHSVRTVTARSHSVNLELDRIWQAPKTWNMDSRIFKAI